MRSACVDQEPLFRKSFVSQNQPHHRNRQIGTTESSRWRSNRRKERKRNDNGIKHDEHKRITKCNEITITTLATTHQIFIIEILCNSLWLSNIFRVSIRICISSNACGNTRTFSWFGCINLVLFLSRMWGCWSCQTRTSFTAHFFLFFCQVRLIP